MWEQEVNTFMESLIAAGTIINGTLREVNETRKTAIAIVYIVDIPTDKVVEQYYYVWKPSDTILFKGMDRLPTRY